MTDLLSAHKESAESLDDKARLGMFYAWLSFSWAMRANCDIAYKYLSKALAIGKEIKNQKVLCYAYTWLAWVYPNTDIQKALLCVEKAQETYKLLELNHNLYSNPWDHYLYFKSLAGIGWACFFAGGAKRAIVAGNDLIEYGHKHSNIRSMGIGHMFIAVGHIIAGDNKSAIKFYQKADEILTDPFLSNWASSFLGSAQLLDGRLEEAEVNMQKVLAYSKKFGTDIPSIAATAYLGLISIMKGKFSHGMKMIEESKKA